MGDRYLKRKRGLSGDAILPPHALKSSRRYLGEHGLRSAFMPELWAFIELLKRGGTPSEKGGKY
jgi:hypothetical protein